MRASIKSADELPLLLTVEHVRQVLGVSRTTVYELMSREGFPALRIGKAIRVPREALLRWIAAGGTRQPAE